MSPQSQIFLLTPNKEDYIVAYAFGSDQNNRVQTIYCSKIVIGSRPSPTEMFNLQDPILDETHLNQHFLKVGRYSDFDVVENRRNYILNVNANVGDVFDNWINFLPIK